MCYCIGTKVLNSVTSTCVDDCGTGKFKSKIIAFFAKLKYKYQIQLQNLVEPASVLVQSVLTRIINALNVSIQIFSFICSLVYLDLALLDFMIKEDK
jgi:hypothetical protein